MKKLLLLALILVSQLNLNAVVGVQDWTTQFSNSEVQALTPDMTQMSFDKFMDLTPKKYRQMTGERLGLKKAVQLKAAQKAIKKATNKKEIESGVYVLLAILGLGWFAMGMLDDWSGSDWIVNLLLTALCWLPGVIHALVKKKNYY
ncbi:MAG: YqaE/Pmp3 family membrane protein [Saprospiraceae bacterium]